MQHNFMGMWIAPDYFLYTYKVCMCIFRERYSIIIDIATRVVDTNRHFLNHTEIGSLYMHSLIKLMGFPTCMWCHCGHVDFIIHVQGDSDHTAQ